MSEVAPPLPARREIPVVGTLLVLWGALYLLMMAHGGWHWNTGGFFGFGMPSRATLREFGALVPAEPRWQSFWLAPLLQRSLLGLLLLGFFWRATGRRILALLGPSLTFVTFVVGGFAGAVAHALAHAGSSAIGGAGPIDPILGAVGLQLGWGLAHPSARGLLRSSLGTLVGLCLWIGIGLLLQGVRDLTSPRMREMLGLEAMLGALIGGVLLAFTIGLARSIGGAETRWLGRVVAGLLVFGLLGAIATQAGPLLRSAERHEAQSFLQQLRRVERSVDGLLDQRSATQAKREQLTVELGRLVKHTFLEEYAGREALLAYAEVLRQYTQPVQATFLVEPQLRKRFARWYEDYEVPLRKDLALRRSGRTNPWRDD